ncbi:hypothetical protein [Streptomyces sp. NPDC001054]
MTRTTLTPAELRAAIDDNRPVSARRAACGLRRPWDVPGIFTRFCQRRCVPCCHALGIPTGEGVPDNETPLETVLPDLDNEEPTR